MPRPNPLLLIDGMEDRRGRLEQRLLGAVEAGNAVMTEMAGHLVTAGGKRIRPLLTVAVASTVGEPSDSVLDGGVAVELVHLGSLYHDDVIDEATTRRGVESVNARWGNLKAILAGDFLLARASEIAASLSTEVAGLLAATICRLCEGEVKELQHAYDPARTEADYLSAIEGKTAALFACGCRIGGLVGGLPRDQIEAVTAFGLYYGMAFQVVDDLLDVTSSSGELGKPAGHDLTEGIYTLPVIRALKDQQGDELRALLGSPLSGERLDRARELVRDGPGLAEAVEVARGYVEQAVAALSTLEPGDSTTAMAGAARHLVADL